MKVLKLELMFYWDNTNGNPYTAGKLIDIETDKVLYYQKAEYGRPDNLERLLMMRYIKDNNLNITHGSELKNLGVYVDKQEFTVRMREIISYSKQLGNEGAAL